MGAKVLIEFNSAGFHEVINQPAVQSLVVSVAANIAKHAPKATSRSFKGGFGGGRPVAVATVKRRRYENDKAFQDAVKALEGAVHI